MDYQTLFVKLALSFTGAYGAAAELVFIFPRVQLYFMPHILCEFPLERELSDCRSQRRFLWVIGSGNRRAQGAPTFY
jgi:hypothetical protein